MDYGLKIDTPCGKGEEGLQASSWAITVQFLNNKLQAFYTGAPFSQSDVPVASLTRGVPRDTQEMEEILSKRGDYLAVPVNKPQRGYLKGAPVFIL